MEIHPRFVKDIMTSLLEYILCVCIILNTMAVADIPSNETSSRQKKRGSSSGTCASGYGVCCVFNLNCGSTFSENCTYLTQEATSMSFSIGGPVVGTTETVAANAGAIGDCTTDQFSVTAPGGVGSPVICGFNSGQHIIVDASDQCHKAAFTLSGSAATRSWDIKVTQYTCSQQEGATHLSNQCYNICIRRESGRCAICYVPNFADSIAGAIISSQVAFGLSVSPAAIAESATGADCTTDYLLIPGAQDVIGPAMPLAQEVAMSGLQGRICGRVLSSMTGKGLGDAYLVGTPAMQISVCSQATPFVITFKTDDNEVETGADALTAEVKVAPGGIIGFSLDYQQLAC
eukprot:TCALIF_13615-PA protein Name:"Protein of unknown function" AED:0.10 eAED:0.10 QI:0/0.63/0.66/0.91/0.54/0.66/12/94/345